MSDLSEMVKKHAEAQEKISNSWGKAFKDAKEKIQNENKSKRDQLKEQLSKLRDEEQKLSHSLADKEKQSTLELAKITVQLNALQIKNKVADSSSTYEKQSEIFKTIGELRSQQMDQIWREIVEDINAIIERHKDRVKRIEQVLLNKFNEERNLLKLSDQSGSHESDALKAQEKNICYQRSKDCIEFVGHLERVRKDIDKKMEEMAELDNAEKEKIQKIEDRYIKGEQKERKEEMDKFVAKVKSVNKCGH